ILTKISGKMIILRRIPGFIDRVGLVYSVFFNITIGRLLMANKLKHTPLYQNFVDLGAKIVEFGGWAMPVQFSSIKEEHNAVRTKTGLFDVSHMGEILIKGDRKSVV